LKLTLLYIFLTLNIIPAAGLKSRLEAYLNARIKNSVRYEFKILRVPKAEKILIDKSRRFSRSGKLAYIPVLLVNGKNRAKSYLTIRLKLFKNCYVALKEIPRGENLKPEYFTISIMDVTTLAKEPVTDLSAITRFRAMRFIRKGEILYKEDLQKIPLIFSGEAVEGRYISGRVMIQMRVVAQQNGWKNKIIKVKGPNNRIFTAKVLDKRLVLLME